MSLLRIARAALVSRAIVGLLALRRRAAARERRVRLAGAGLLALCGVGAVWATRGSGRILGSADAGGARPEGLVGLAVRATAKRAPSEATAAPPSIKKQRKRARRAQAEQREKAVAESAHGGPVKIEINQTPDLRAPLAELIKP
ncbi:MAG: hypothetical protein NVS4B10_05090 [Myxococcales bacterium]